MDIAFEFARAIIATVSRRCTNLIIDSATKHNTFRRGVVNTGHLTNKAYVHLKYFGGLWFSKQKDKNEKGEKQIKITLNVKPIDEAKALELGADMLGEIAVLFIMLSLVATGLTIRRTKSLEQIRIQIAKEDEIREKIKQIDSQLFLLNENIALVNHRLDSLMQKK